MGTIGYGDVLVIEPAGKVVAVVTIVIGITLLAIPITILSSNFTHEYEKMVKTREAAENTRKKKKAVANRQVVTSSLVHLDSTIECINKIQKNLVISLQKRNTIRAHNLTKSMMDMLSDYQAKPSFKKVFRSFKLDSMSQ